MTAIQSVEGRTGELLRLRDAIDAELARAHPVDNRLCLWVVRAQSRSMSAFRCLELGVRLGRVDYFGITLNPWRMA